MKTLKFWELPASIKHLEFDGDKTDLRLHHNSMIHWGVETESEYKAIEAQIDAFTRTGNGWSAYAWCDISGFDYWHVTMEEDNYVQFTVTFDKEDISADEIEAIENAIDDFDFEFGGLQPIHYR